MQSDIVTLSPESETDLHAEALKRLQKKRDFRVHLLAYVLVNALLWAIWGVTGAGFPWPIFASAGWGIGLVFHAWDTYGWLPFTEEDIRREEARLLRR